MARVAVVVPLHNRAAFIGRTLESVMAQTEPDWQLVVVDDGSSDASAALAERTLEADPRSRVIRQANAGVNRTRNVGAQMIDAPRVMFLDADDLLRPRALEELLATDGAVVTGIFDAVDENDKSIQPLPSYFQEQPVGRISMSALVNGARITTCATILDTNAFHDAGGWDEGFGQGLEDVHLYLRLALRGGVIRIPKTVASYRLHSSQMSLDHGRMANQKAKLLAAMETWGSDDPELSAAIRRYWRRTLPAERLHAAWSLLLQGKPYDASVTLASAAKRFLIG